MFGRLIRRVISRMKKLNIVYETAHRHRRGTERTEDSFFSFAGEVPAKEKLAYIPGY